MGDANVLEKIDESGCNAYTYLNETVCYKLNDDIDTIVPSIVGGAFGAICLLALILGYGKIYCDERKKKRKQQSGTSLAAISDANASPEPSTFNAPAADDMNGTAKA